ncbi:MULTISPECIES: DUF427 domain-containing protein [unclassified Frankia]|uniref:DUF427 domain-containing protein n=1 Tax=unclassified Frankia TaxID=2632575 RepID=UPI002AD545A6|nr:MULTISPECIES: DUF427 domain-containing protein [unclassified Frankia]
MDNEGQHIRIEPLPNPGHLRIDLDGVTIAESSGPRLLLETGAPVRYYLPKAHVRMELLEPSDTITHCPHKGTAEYWSVRVNGQLYRDHAWSYPAPLPDGQPIAGLIAFRRTDTYVDGVLQQGR